MKDVTVLFLRKADKVLLALKKRGFGEGKWNGVGGKTHSSETPEEAVTRECQEEIGVTPTKLKPMGEIEFYMEHDPSFRHHAHLFVAEEWEGEPKETEEMRPEWFKLEDVPYDDMWAGDIMWLPLVLEGIRISAAITFGAKDEVIKAEISRLD
ncbi:MAG TPA: 8-oxo-dGTP diphosphatase [Candidatus Saccharimonadales bacterium]|nr:8-oxo-dGTP diphosphatase [Candidatus Saccharimonadales bacterium]